MALNLGIPETQRLKPQIIVFGLGGAGGNAVNNMIRTKLAGVDFVCANTDAQALAQCLTDRRVQLGVSFTQGLGAGSRPEVGRAAAEEALEEIINHLQGSNMCFIAAGMGGGTGTGAAPVVARAAREMGILTVGVVTKPFHFEGTQRMRVAEEGITELQQFVDTLIVIPNQNLFRVANDKTTFADAFNMADGVLSAGVRGVTDLMVQPGLINLDFADVRTVMGEMGKAMMGTGEAEGEKRATEAAEAAISNPLLDDVSMKGARGVLINITGGSDMTLFEVDEAANRIREEVDPDANIIFGATFDETLTGRMRISLVATGIDAQAAASQSPYRSQAAGRPQGTPMRPVLVKNDAVGAPAERPAVASAPLIAAAEASAMAVRTSQVLASSGQAALAMQEVELEVQAPVHVASAPAASQPAAAQASTPDVAPAPRVEPAPPRAESSGPAAEPARDRFIPTRPVEPRRPFVAAPAKPAESTEERRRIPSLFERMTGTGRARSDKPAAEAPKPSPRAEPTAEASELFRAQPADRLASQSFDDVLDIPAFLRRQAN
jgi:cell division protein FtsZ